MAESYKTVISTLTSFASGADLVTYRDWRVVADLLNDDDTRVANSAAVQGHATVALALKTASGQIESAVYRGGRYTRADLQRLLASFTDDEGTGARVAADMLKHLTCELAFWFLLKRRKPDIRPEMVAGIPEALEMLERFRLAEAVFPFYETVDSQGTDIAPFDSEVTKSTYVYEPLSRQSIRMFGTRARDLRE